MKKKKLLAACAGLTVLVIMVILSNIGSELFTDSISLVQIRTETYEQKYRTYGTVSAQLHSCFYNGMITSIDKNERDQLKVDDVILKYRDSDDKERELKSEINGYLYAINPDCVQIYDSVYYLSVLLREEYFDMVAIGSEGLFSVNGHDYLITARQKNDYGIIRNGTVMYEVIFDFDSQEKLKLNQQGNVTLLMGKQEGVSVIDRNALLENSDGYYLLDSSWLKDTGNMQKYLRKVEVSTIDDEVAVIEGTDLENRQFCVIDENIRSLLADD